MNDNNETAWSVFWWLLICPTLLVALPLSFQEQGWAGGGPVLAALVFEVLMLALPSIWGDWKRNAPNRQRARAASRERAAERARLQTERDEGRRQRQAEQARQREAKMSDTRARHQATAARQEAEAYYRLNAALLEDVLPPSLFKAEVEAAFPSGTEPEAAWQTARDLIAHMQPLVRQERERRRQETELQARRAEEARDIDTQIRAHEARIRTVRASALDPDLIEDEVAAEREIIERLREQRAALQHPR
jgi:hypothetical protein